jgi:hypothetical protein
MKWYVVFTVHDFLFIFFSYFTVDYNNVIFEISVKHSFKSPVFFNSEVIDA